jgi:hypothetical protein
VLGAALVAVHELQAAASRPASGALR